MAQHSLDKEKQEKKKKKFSGYIFNGDGDGDGADDDGSDNDYNDGDGGGNGDSEIDNFIKDIDSGLTASDSDQDSELKGNSTLLDREQQSASLKVSGREGTCSKRMHGMAVQLAHCQLKFGTIWERGFF